MQIIAGSKRGAKLAMVADLSVRPTAHRTRESLFNILQGGRMSVDLQDAVILDLFAGSGALACEALSRGAAQAFIVEKHHDAIAIIRQNVRRLGFEDRVKLSQSDCLKTSHWPHQAATIVFCDPPYDKGLALPAIDNFARLGAIAEGALIVIETRKSEQLALPESLIQLEQRRYGMALLTFCRYQP